MRVVMVSKALIVGAYQRKAEEVARLGVDLTVLVPTHWRDRRGYQLTEFVHTACYELRVVPLVFNGNYHLHFYPTLWRMLRQLRPDVVHIDEEPYNLATWLGIGAARRVGAVPTFFTWQNLLRCYPLPFRWMEQANYRGCPIAIAGNRDAAEVLRQKGYAGGVRVIPQFGVDPEIFSPSTGEQESGGAEARGRKGTGTDASQTAARNPSSAFHIGYAGGLIPEKGVDLLLRACAALQGEWRLTIAGSGEEAAYLQTLAHSLGIAHRVDVGNRVPSHKMPAFYQLLDVLVLPSRTQPNWKEQFGRVLIEAMACGVPVIGSTCGEIPNVIGDAGFIFPEADWQTLQCHLQHLLDDPAERGRLAQAGRRRVLERYTMQRVASETVSVYRELLKAGRTPFAG